MSVEDGGKRYNVVIVGSPNVNPGYKLVGNAAYPQIADDYARGFRVLKSLQCDIFLGAHGSYFDLDGKYPRMKTSGAAAFVDPDGYKRYIENRERAYRTELEKQKNGG
jgi:metallo-beta-lactamase class B